MIIQPVKNFLLLFIFIFHFFRELYTTVNLILKIHTHFYKNVEFNKKGPVLGPLTSLFRQRVAYQPVRSIIFCANSAFSASSDIGSLSALKLPNPPISNLSVSITGYS